MRPARFVLVIIGGLSALGLGSASACAGDFAGTEPFFAIIGGVALALAAWVE